VRLNDGLINAGHGLIASLIESISSGVLFSVYIHIHGQYGFSFLSSGSTMSCIIIAVSIDFCYYWIHRAAHEVNILWAAHQVHHSSEDFNLTTGLRQSAFQIFGAWPFYLPLALFVPPMEVIVHKELNLLYQFLIHTEVIRSFGPLEVVFNSASHHRVHHGSNLYCLDKNYGGVLIIWDRMFGTFAEENKSKIVYGLRVDPPQNWNIIKQQLFYFVKVIEKAKSQNSWKHSMFAVFKGPGWGLDESVYQFEAPVREKFDVVVSRLLHFYTALHFFTGYWIVIEKIDSAVSNTSIPIVVFFVLWSLVNLGMLYEDKYLAWPSELVRLSLTLLLMQQMKVVFALQHQMLQLIFTGSILTCSVVIAVRFVGMKANAKVD